MAAVHTIFVLASAERSLHLVQGLKTHLRLIHGSMILDNIRTRFLGGDLSARATYTRVYTVSNSIAIRKFITRYVGKFAEVAKFAKKSERENL